MRQLIIFLFLLCLVGCAKHDKDVELADMMDDTEKSIQYVDETGAELLDENATVENIEERIWISNCEDVKEMLLSVDGVLDVEITPSDYEEYQKQGKVTIKIATEPDFSKDLEPNIENLGAFDSFEIEYIEGTTE